MKYMEDYERGCNSLYKYAGVSLPHAGEHRESPNATAAESSAIRVQVAIIRDDIASGGSSSGRIRVRCSVCRGSIIVDGHSCFGSLDGAMIPDATADFVECGGDSVKNTIRRMLAYCDFMLCLQMRPT